MGRTVASAGIALHGYFFTPKCELDQQSIEMNHLKICERIFEKNRRFSYPLWKIIAKTYTKRKFIFFKEIDYHFQENGRAILFELEVWLACIMDMIIYESRISESDKSALSTTMMKLIQEVYSEEVERHYGINRKELGELISHRFHSYHSTEAIGLSENTNFEILYQLLIQSPLLKAQGFGKYSKTMDLQDGMFFDRNFTDSSIRRQVLIDFANGNLQSLMNTVYEIIENSN